MTALGIRAARTAVAIVVSAAAITWLLLSCVDPPPSAPDSHDPDADACCWGLVFPWLAEPGECLCDYTAIGTKRWLTCATGTYWCDRRFE